MMDISSANSTHATQTTHNPASGMQSTNASEPATELEADMTPGLEDAHFDGAGTGAGVPMRRESVMLDLIVRSRRIGFLGAVLGGLVLSLSSPPVLAATGDPLTPEQLVGPGFYAPSLARNSAGDIAIAWEGDDGLYLRRYSPSGAPLGNALKIYDFPPSPGVTDPELSLDNPNVAINASGQVVVTWAQRLRLYSPSEVIESIQVLRLDADDVPIGTVQTVQRFSDADAGFFEVGLPAVDMDDQGRYVVTWKQDRDIYVVTLPTIPSPTPLYLRTDTVQHQPFSADGAPIGPIRQADYRSWTNLVPGKSLIAPQVAMGTEGEYVLAWHRSGPTSSAVPVQRYKADGSVRGLELRADPVLENPYNQNCCGLSLAITPDDKPVVAWERIVQGEGYDGRSIQVSHFTPGLIPLVKQFEADHSETQSQQPRVSVDASGRLAVTWISAGGPRELPAPAQLNARYFQPNGTPVSAPLTLKDNLSTTAYDMDVAADGSLALAWQDYPQSRIYLRLFQGF